MNKNIIFALIFFIMTMGGLMPLWAGQDELNACRDNLMRISGALKECWNQRENKFPDTLSELKGTYLKTLPVCPMGGKYEYTVNEQRKRYTLECRGWAHRDVIGKSQPIIISFHESFEILPEPTPPATLDREVRKVQFEKRICNFLNKIKENPIMTWAFIFVILFSLFLWITKWKAKREKIRKIDELIS